ncbi:MAG: sugar transferase [Bacteroidota bacterium]|nr:sugar transferase [Bacteroidota bacterium]
MYILFVKRILDFFLAFLAFSLLSPVFLFFLLLLAYVNKGKPLFFQERPGKNEKIFRVIKFKTMTDDKDVEGNLLPDKERITKVGRFIRKNSIDEIPQLINVIRGDMSIVGPRPLSKKYLKLYNKEQHKRHNVLPGITGWAQVNGRNSLPWKKRFEYDLWYVEHISFKTDLKIIILTIKNVLNSKNVEEEGASSVQSFTGNN